MNAQSLLAAGFAMVLAGIADAGTLSASGHAVPSPVPQDGCVTIVMAVTPALAPYSTGILVNIDLSAFGGSATQPCYDDGTHGDAVAGDNLFTPPVICLSCAFAQGTYLVPFLVSDNQGRTDSGTVPVIVGPPLCPCAAGSASAAYTVSGPPSNTPWSWKIVATTGAFATLEDQNVPGVPNTGTTLDIAQAFADSINNSAATLNCGPAGVQALAIGGATVQLSIQAPGAFDLYVGAAGTSAACPVGTTLPACTFNPSILQRPNSGHDCNYNGWDDAIDISWGRSADLNHNGVPDECECGSADFNHDGDIGTDADIEAFFACLGGNCCASCGSVDFNGDGDLGTDADIESFFRVLGGGSC